MKLLLDDDTLDMILSVERIDVDYKRADMKQSKDIVSFIEGVIPHLSPRALTVLITDIEIAQYHTCGGQYPHNTLDNWRGIETKAIEQLASYGVKSYPNGLYTEFDSISGCKYELNHEIEISEEKLRWIMRLSFDYALGRRTYAVDETIQFILRYKDILTHEDAQYMIGTIKEYELGLNLNTLTAFTDKMYLSNWLAFSEQLEKI